MNRLILSLFALACVAHPSWLVHAEEPDVVTSASIAESPNGHVLRIQAKVRDGLHIYSQSQPPPFRAAKILVTEASEGVREVGDFTADREPHVVRHKELDVELHEFSETVTWEAPLQIDGDAGNVSIQGTLFAQACEDGRCFDPKVYTFAASLGEGAPTQPFETAVVAELPESNSSTDGAFSLENLDVEAAQSTQSIWGVLPFAFLAGFLLNLMPCVLPVVGLKLLSFVQQAQSDRRRILLMNLSYTAGLVSVMLVLASLAVFAGMGWGEQFSSTGFTITLAAIVFAFGLSFLGVWEIPLPGFVSTADGKTPQEGYAGAFSKGILSTLLATPCSGPFLGTALAWAVTQSAVFTYAVFVTVGLGMASPYLVIGAFPSLIRFLPKPGNWMITFKYVMGFVMLATVVYLLSFVAIASVVPTILLLLGIGIAVWFAGQTPFTATRSKKLRAWGIAALMILASSSVSFGWLKGIMQDRFERAAMRFAADRIEGDSAVDVSSAVSNEEGISWQDYSPERLESAIASGQPVFVDFTADWCLTCKANEAAAVNTPDLANALRDNQVLALRADKTEPNPEADSLLRKLGNSAASIPFYAVFHPENPGHPILLDGVFASHTAFVDAVQRRTGKEKEDIAAKEPIANPPETPQSTATLHSEEIDWQPYSPELLRASLDSGQPVFVDFTADWCPACKKNHAAAIDTDEFRSAMQDKQIVALLADKTQENLEADALLKKLGNTDGHIPFYAVIHPDDSDNPKVLDGAIVSPQPFINAVLQTDSQEPSARVSGDEIAWQPYSPELMEDSLAAGHPVFVDFTADWCPACKKNHAAAIETPEFKAALRDKNIVAMLADKTQKNTAADALLKKLGNSDGHIPFYAIIHPDNSNDPVVLDGSITSPQPFVEAFGP